MVKTSHASTSTMRATSTMSEGAQTMIEHNSTMLESDLGTMVINSDEEDGTMKSKKNTFIFMYVLNIMKFYFCKDIYLFSAFTNIGYPKHFIKMNAK